MAYGRDDFTSLEPWGVELSLETRCAEKWFFQNSLNAQILNFGILKLCQLYKTRSPNGPLGHRENRDLMHVSSEDLFGDPLHVREHRSPMEAPGGL